MTTHLRRAALLVALLATALMVPAPAHAAQSLDEAFAAELRSLETERAALVAARDAARLRRAERNEALRNDVARLDARVLSASAERDALKAAVADLERMARVAPAQLVDAARLAAQLADIERGGRIQRVDGGFFDRDGAFVTGAVLQVGNAAAVGVSPLGAGPLAHVAEGGLQVAVAPGVIADAARAALAGQGELPLFFGRAPQDDPRVDGSTVDVLLRGGTLGAVVIAVAILTLLATLARALWLLTARRAARRLVPDVVALVRQRELLAAFGRCRQERGAAAALFGAVVGELSADPTAAEDRSGAQLLATHAALDRGRMLTLGGIAATLVGAALVGLHAIEHTLIAFAGASAQPVPALLDAIAAGLSPATIAVGAALPSVLLALMAASWSARLGAELEGGVLELLDAARSATRDELAKRSGVTILPSPGREARA